MTSQYRHRRTSSPSTPFPANIEPGEIAVNTANRQLSVGDAAAPTLGVPKPLLAIRFFDPAAQYAADDIVIQAGVAYRANAVIPPGTFNAANWTVMADAATFVNVSGDTMTGHLALPTGPAAANAVRKDYVDTADAALTTLAGTKVDKAGGAGSVMTGFLTLNADPQTALHAATKQYIDNKPAALLVSDAPPAPPVDNTMWWDSDTGTLYVRYNDGAGPSQWVQAVAVPAIDTSAFVAKTGDTMTGTLVVSHTQPQLLLNKAASGTGALIYGQTAGKTRWLIQLGNAAAESTGDVGSDFRITRYNDAGTGLDNPIHITRSTGLATVLADPTAPLGIATKQYVDNKMTRYDVGGLNTKDIAVPATATGARITGSLAASATQAYTMLQLSVAAGVFKNTIGDYFLYGMQHQTSSNTAINGYVNNANIPGLYIHSASDSTLHSRFDGFISLKRANTSASFIYTGTSWAYSAGSLLSQLTHNFLAAGVSGSALQVLAMRFISSAAPTWSADSYITVEWF